MTKRRFAKRWAFAAIMATAFAAPAASAQQAGPPLKAARPIKTGDVLSGELNAMSVRDVNNGKRVATYQITSEPRRLPPPSGLCNLETRPETSQLVTTSDAQAVHLKNLVGKEIAVRLDELACAQATGRLSGAVDPKWRRVP